MTATMEHITKHVAATFYEHSPPEKQQALMDLFGVRKSTFQKRRARHIETRSLKAEEILAGLHAGLLDEEFLTDLLAPYGYSAFRIEGFEPKPCEIHCEGLDLHAQQAIYFSNGKLESHEKRLSLKRGLQFLSKFAGYLHWMKKTQNTTTNVYLTD